MLTIEERFSRVEEATEGRSRPLRSVQAAEKSLRQADSQLRRAEKALGLRIEPRKLKAHEIYPHGPHPGIGLKKTETCRTAEDWCVLMGLESRVWKNIQSRLWDAESACCFGATNNAGIIVSYFNEELKATGIV